MDDDKKKIVMIAVCVVCIGFAGYMLKSTFFPPTSTPSSVTSWLICNNPNCRAQFSVESEELWELMNESPTDGGMPGKGPIPMGPQVVKCKECNKNTAYIGQKCSNEQCGQVFIPNPQFGIKCPKCGQ